MKSILDLGTPVEKRELFMGDSTAIYVTSTRGYVCTLQDAGGNILDFQAFPCPKGYMGGDAEGAWLWCDVKVKEREDHWLLG
jgi:hypothetical protein